MKTRKDKIESLKNFELTPWYMIANLCEDFGDSISFYFKAKDDDGSYKVKFELDLDSYPHYHDWYGEIVPTLASSKLYAYIDDITKADSSIDQYEQYILNEVFHCQDIPNTDFDQLIAMLIFCDKDMDNDKRPLNTVKVKSKYINEGPMEWTYLAIDDRLIEYIHNALIKVKTSMPDFKGGVYAYNNDKECNAIATALFETTY